MGREYVQMIYGSINLILLVPTLFNVCIIIIIIIIIIAQGPLSVVSTTEELLERKSSDSSL
jgi:hypothetical protein